MEKFAWRQSVEPAADLIILSNDFKKRFLVLWTVKKKNSPLYFNSPFFVFLHIYGPAKRNVKIYMYHQEGIKFTLKVNARAYFI